MTKTRDVLLFFVGTLLQQIVTFASGVFVARWLGPDNYGVLSLVRNVYTVALILAPLGLDLSLLRHLGENDHDRPRAMAQVGAFRVITAIVNCLVVLAVFLVIGPWVEARFYPHPHFSLYLSLTFLSLPFAADVAILAATLRALNRPAFQAIASLYLQPLARLGALILFLVMGMGLIGVILSTTVGVTVSMVTMSVALFLLLRREKTPPHKLEPQDRATLRRVYGYSAWLASMLLAYGILRNIDILVLGRFRPSKEVGEYAALSGLAQIIQIYPFALSQTLAPAVARLYAQGDLAGMRRELGDYLRKASLLASPIFAGLAVFGPWLDLLFGPKYHFQASLSFNLALAYYLSGVLGPMGVSLSMTGRHRREFAVLIIGLVGSIAGCVWAAPRFGANGVAIAITAGYAFVNIVRAVLSARFTQGMDAEWADLYPPLTCLAIAHVWRLFLEHFFARSLLVAVPGAIGVCLIFAAAYWLFLLRPPEKAFVVSKLPLKRLGLAKGAG
ncbi:MAG: flippase [Caulobacteraceae bacterium]|nr:flippase [Caulobacteraceae bacterium]